MDIRSEVAAAAHSAMLACCQTAGNRDLEPHVPALVSCIARPGEVPDVIGKLSATTFVQVRRAAWPACKYTPACHTHALAAGLPCSPPARPCVCPNPHPSRRPWRTPAWL